MLDIRGEGGIIWSMTSTTNFNQLQHKTTKQNPLPKGFTIIEVVLVLAIAGLIFLMVFIALPALQRNQRDTQRKNDISRLQDAIERYKANNKGQLPWAADTHYMSTNSYTVNFLNSYLKRDQGEWGDPSGVEYRVFVNDPDVIPGWVHPGYRYYVDAYNQNRMFMKVAAQCNGNTFVLNDQPNTYALMYALEGGGSVCVDG